jgi:hypothetical protein
MATKAQQFKAEQQREARAPRTKKVRKRRDALVDTSLPGVSASDRKAGGGQSGERNKAERVNKKGGPKLENSATGKPSRKSTRGSQGRVKQASNLQRREVRKTTSSKARATRAKAAAKRVR